MIELADIRNAKVNYKGNEIPLSELPGGMYSIQLGLNHPSFPYVRGDGTAVAERIFESPLNKSGRLKCRELKVDEVEHPDMFRFEGESA